MRTRTPQRTSEDDRFNRACVTDRGVAREARRVRTNVLYVDRRRRRWRCRSGKDRVPRLAVAERAWVRARDLPFFYLFLGSFSAQVRAHSPSEECSQSWILCDLSCSCKENCEALIKRL